MSLRSLWREIKRTFTFWRPIKKPPRWIEKRINSIVSAAASRPVDKKGQSIYFKKHFVGKNYIYKVAAENAGQGNATVRYFRKKRIK